jgi:hypothetical protein
MTVAELSGRLSSHELSEWQAYYALEPWGTEIDLMGHAITASTVHNVHRGKRGKALSYQDFMPKFGVAKKEQTEGEMLQFVEILNAGLGGKDLRGEHGTDG